MGDQEHQSKGKRVHFLDHPGPCPLEECPEFKPIKPFREGFINVNFNVYNKGEPKTEINEDALDSFIDRVLLSASMNLDQQQPSYGIMDADDGRLTHPANVIGRCDDKPVSYKEQNKKSRKNDKKGKKGRKNEARKKNETEMNEKTLEDYVIGITYPHDPNGLPNTLVIPIWEYRRLMMAEVNARARHVHEYYEYHFNNLQGDRIIAYRNLVVWKEHASRMQKELQEAVYELRRLDEINQEMAAELQKIKSAKKQKRHAAKQRKMNNSEAAQSVSHT